MAENTNLNNTYKNDNNSSDTNLCNESYDYSRRLNILTEPKPKENNQSETSTNSNSKDNKSDGSNG